MTTVATREHEHSLAFTKRIDELGFELEPGDVLDFTKQLEIVTSDCSDYEKAEALGLFERKVDTGERDIFAGLFDDQTIDIQTGALLGRYIAEERDSGRMIVACAQALKARHDGGGSVGPAGRSRAEGRRRVCRRRSPVRSRGVGGLVVERQAQSEGRGLTDRSRAGAASRVLTSSGNRNPFAGRTRERGWPESHSSRCSTFGGGDANRTRVQGFSAFGPQTRGTARRSDARPRLPIRRRPLRRSLGVQVHTSGVRRATGGARERPWRTITTTPEVHRAILVDVSSTAAPVVDPIRRPHLALVDPAFRNAIEQDIEHCHELLTYLRDR